MPTEKMVVLASNLCKTYEVGDLKVEALKNVNFKVKDGEFTVISGPSGSGKTTLLNVIGGIDKPTSGKIIVFGKNLGVKDEDFLATFRCRKVGFVFQSYNLISTLTVAENIAFPMEWMRKPENHIKKRVEELLEIVGLQHRTEHFPSQLSGGEQQRVAIARALANDPPLLLADEPTGNLDAKTSLKIVEILKMLKENGKTIIVATHDEQILRLADQMLFLEDGKLVNPLSETFFPINDLFRRKLQTSLIVISLTLSVASTLFLLLSSDKIGFGISLMAEGILTVGFSIALSRFIIFTGILIFVIGALLISFMVFVMMSQRVRDIGLMKAAGCPNDLIFGYFMNELLIVIFLGCLLGVVLGIAADFALTSILTTLGFQISQKPINFWIFCLFSPYILFLH
jgi:putative ABC transport system ATP-binding protein